VGGTNYTTWSAYRSAYPAFDVHSVTTDPLFANAVAFDFHLLLGSPCIDKGISVGLGQDYDRGLVPFGKTVDIGAFEFVGNLLPAPTNLKIY
jgi:hypothetical protein